MSQSPETNAKFAIRPKKIIGSMLASIHVIQENKRYVNYHCFFFTFPINTVTQSYDTSAVLPQLFLVEVRNSPKVVLKSVQFFFSSSCAKIHVQTLSWTECFKQIHRQYLVLGYKQIALNFLLNFPLIA
jgi:hypothetical protein